MLLSNRPCLDYFRTTSIYRGSILYWHFRVNLLSCFRKLDHFRAKRKIIYNNEMRYLTKYIVITILYHKLRWTPELKRCVEREKRRSRLSGERFTSTLVVSRSSGIPISPRLEWISYILYNRVCAGLNCKQVWTCLEIPALKGAEISDSKSVLVYKTCE